MLNTNKDIGVHKEITMMINLIAHELVEGFGKSEIEALELIRASNVEESLKNDKLGFHESPYNWAVSILTEHADFKTLEKYLH